MQEIWKDSSIINNYEVSNFGHIRMKGKTNNLTPQDDGNGYKKISARVNKIRKNFSVHKLIATEFVNNPNHYKEINHKDGNKGNNVALNLEWCTRSENMLHSVYVLGNRPGKRKIKML